MSLRILDLCAGLESWSKPYRERGHVAETLDYDLDFGCTYTADVREVTPDDLDGPYDFIVASPPCEGFSVGSIGRHWNLPGGRGTKAEAKSDGARLGVEIALAVVDLIDALAPPLGFLIENPTGMMRHLLGFQDGKRGDLSWVRWRHDLDSDNFRAPSVTYCTLGLPYRKPTDLWVGGPIADYLDLPAPCKTNSTSSVDLPDGRHFRINKRTGEPCHEVAERGARTGIQGVATYAERSVIPHDLCQALVDATENAADPAAPPIVRAPAQPSLADVWEMT